MDEEYERLARQFSEFDRDSLHTAIVELGVDALAKSPGLLVKRARSRAIDVLRRGGKVDRFSVAGECEVSDGAEEPIIDLIGRERCQLVSSAVNGLKHLYQEVIELRYFRDMTVREIALKLKVPEATVRTRLNRARACLSQNKLLEGWRS